MTLFAKKIPVGNPLYSTTFNVNQACGLDNDNPPSSLPSCDLHDNGDLMRWDIGGGGGGVFSDPYGTQAHPDANNSNGGGGYGLRQYIDDGTNNQGGSPELVFDDIPGADANQTELWMRWYERWESGFKWAGSGTTYKKVIYMRTDDYRLTGGTEVIPGYNGISVDGTPDFAINRQGAAGVTSIATSVSFGDIFGTTAQGGSDGLFHLFEVHLIMDTTGTGDFGVAADGVAQAWVDDVLVLDRDDINFSGGVANSLTGWTWMQIPNNNRGMDNGGIMYFDIDDFEIYNETPPATDGSGNPYIGPLNGFTGG